MLKINWFSPLPPARSGIAQNFAMQLLPALARHFEVVLWTDQDQVAPEVQRMARVARYAPDAPPWREINDGAISVYTGKTEVGQNVRTSLTQAVAEELRCAPSSIQMVVADTDLTPYDMGTFGSRTTPYMAPQLRKVAAVAREESHLD